MTALRIDGAFEAWGLDGLKQVAVAADGAAVDWIVVPDEIPAASGGAGWPDAFIVAGWLFGFTSRVSIACAVSSLGHQPYNLARRLASLDLASGGRAGWLLAEGDVDAARAAFSGQTRLSGIDLDERAAEFVSVVAQLQESWAPDALLLDKDTAQFFRPDAMRPINHNGTHFSVAGPLNVMRSPRGTPSILSETDLPSVTRVSTPDEALSVIARLVA